jgi:hypothetical protein
MQIIPVDNSPNQNFQCSLSVDGSNIDLEFDFSFSEIASYWLMRITDPATKIILIDSVPLVCGQGKALNILSQYEHFGIGSAYLINMGVATDYPDSTNLGTDFILVWEDTDYDETLFDADAAETATSSQTPYSVLEALHAIVTSGLIPGPKGDTGGAGPRGFDGDTGAGYAATSTTSIIVGTGSQTFTTQEGLAYLAGSRVKATATGSPSAWMEGLVTSYSGTTLIVNITSVSGSGTYADWNLSLTGEQGIPGINITLSTGDPSGGEDGDIWFKYSA